MRDAAQREEMAANVFTALQAGWLEVKPARECALADAAQSHAVLKVAGATTPLRLVP